MGVPHAVRKQRKLSQGLCLKCSRPPINGGRLCLVHKESNRRRVGKITAVRRAAGLCVKCGKVYVEGDHILCEPCLEWNREYVASRRKANPKKYKARTAERYKNDLQFRLSIILRCRMRAAIKSRQKAGSAVDDLGCSIPEFIDYIASKFQDGMTWENHGQWQLDHIKPLASFDLTDREQFLQAAHYSNFQPLWWEDNRAKWYKEVPQ